MELVASLAAHRRGVDGGGWGRFGHLKGPGDSCRCGCGWHDVAHIKGLAGEEGIVVVLLGSPGARSYVFTETRACEVFPSCFGQGSGTHLCGRLPNLSLGLSGNEVCV